MSTLIPEGAVDIEVLVDIEQKFFDEGFEDGMEHGKIHGRIEGREFGKTKGFEMWEELGFYEGFANVWKAASERDGVGDGRVMQNAKLLLDLIAQFPMENPSHGDAAEMDVLKLFNQIRSRYKMLCSLVGVKSSLRAGRSGGQHVNTGEIEHNSVIEKKSKIWHIDKSEQTVRTDYSF